jgi:hypothetical protein
VESSCPQKELDHTYLKTLVIVQHRAHEFANRLWNDLSIYACGIEIGARVINLTGLEHSRFGKYPHAFFAKCVDILTRNTSAIWTTGTPKELPPTIAPSGIPNHTWIYFFGWLFRNPAGLRQHRAELLRAFAPSASVVRTLERVLAPHKGKVLIGVRARQKPFRAFSNGEFLISKDRMREVATEYMREQNLTPDECALIEVFDTGPYDERTGLYLLSRCSVVIGDNSTYSNLAAWFGDVAHIVATEEPIDWQYYRDKSTYFENKYATFTRGSLLYP